MRLYEFEQVDEDWKKTLHGVAAVAGAAIAAHNLPSHDKAQANVRPVSSINFNQEQKAKQDLVNKNRDILALTIWGEARNQGKEGMRAVGHVIKNRADADEPKLFGKGIQGVALKDKQFSFWNDKTPLDVADQVEDIDPALPDGKTWEQAYNIAGKILSGQDPDITNGATYYHTASINPQWAQNATPVARIGDHVFYNDIPQA